MKHRVPMQRLHQPRTVCRAGDVVVDLLLALLLVGFAIRTCIGCVRKCKEDVYLVGCCSRRILSLLLDCTISALMILSKLHCCSIDFCVSVRQVC